LSDVPRTVALTAVTLCAFAGNSLLCRLALAPPAAPASIDALSFTALRIASGAAVLLLLTRPWRAASGARWSPRSALALAAYAVCFSLAYVTLPAGVGALLLFGAVQVTMLGAARLAGERLSAAQMVGLVAAIAGFVVLVAPGLSAPDPGGAALMLAAGVGWGLYSLFGRGLRKPAAANACNFALATPLVALAFLAQAGAAHADPRGAALALVSGTLTSGLGYVAWYAALRGLTATSASIVQLAVPILAAFGGVLFLDERPTLRLALASVLTLGGVALATVRCRARE